MQCFHSYEVELFGDADAKRRALELFEESLVSLDLCDIDNLGDEDDFEDDGYFEDVDGSEEEYTLIDGETMITADYDGNCGVEELLEEGFQEWAKQLAKEKVAVEFSVSGWVELGERYSFSASYEGGKFTSDYGLSTDDDESEDIDYNDDEEDDEE